MAKSGWCLTSVDDHGSCVYVDCSCECHTPAPTEVTGGDWPEDP